MSITALSDPIGKLVPAAATACVPYVLSNLFDHDVAYNKPDIDSLPSHGRYRICTEIESLGGSLYLLRYWSATSGMSSAQGTDRIAKASISRNAPSFCSTTVK